MSAQVEYGKGPAYNSNPGNNNNPGYNSNPGNNNNPGYNSNPGNNNNPGYNSNPGYSNSPNFPRPVQSEHVSGWCDRNQKNKPQSNSAGAAALVFISGGMNIAWSFSYGSRELFTKHSAICWFIAAIIGSFFGAVLCNYIRKKILFLTSSVLIIIGGILFLSLPRNYDAIVAARYIDGLASGLLIAPVLIMCAEEAVKSLRGMISASLETMCFTLGIFLQIIFSACWADFDSDFSIEQLQGTCVLCYGLISIIIAFFLVVESPVFLLVRGQEHEAIDALRRLQRPFVVTTETYEILQEHKAYIAANREMSLGQSAIAGLPALVKLIIYRSLNALTFSAWLSTSFSIISNIALRSFAIWPFVLFGTARYCGSVFTVFVLDSKTNGRKSPMLAGSVVCGGLAIGVGVILNDISSISQANTAMYLLMVFQIFAGYFITSSSPYLCEAFPLAIKPYYIAIAFSIEMLVQIIISVTTLSSFTVSGSYFFATGSLLLCFFVIGMVAMPETRHTTLREAQHKFSKILFLRN